MGNLRHCPPAELNSSWAGRSCGSPAPAEKALCLYRFSGFHPVIAAQIRCKSRHPPPCERLHPAPAGAYLRAKLGRGSMSLRFLGAALAVPLFLAAGAAAADDAAPAAKGATTTPDEPGLKAPPG